MKKVLFAGVAAIALISSGAWAADMPMRAPAPAAFDWGGFYVGAHAGWADNHYTEEVYSTANGGFPVSTALQAVTSGTDNGFAGGFQGGYNWVVTPGWLLGLEADATGSFLRGTGSGCSPIECTSGSGETDGFVSFRARTGIIWNNLLFYATGGYAAVYHRNWDQITCFNATTPDCPSGPSAPLGPFGSNLPGGIGTFAAINPTGLGGEAQQWSNGYVFGGGLEWAFGDRWTARLEYDRYEFRYTYGINFGPCGSSCQGTQQLYNNLAKSISASTDVNTVMFGINYLFWPGL